MKQTYANYFRDYFKNRGRERRLAAQKRYRHKLMAEFPEATSQRQAARIKSAQNKTNDGGSDE